MKLTELEPRFVAAAQSDLEFVGRHGLGLAFNCPCGCGDRCVVYFANPVDGAAMYPVERSGKQTYRWHREGDTFEVMSLTPSINWLEYASGPSHWHGHITHGEVQ